MSENPTPATESFTHAGRTVTVTMTDPPVSSKGEVFVSHPRVSARRPKDVSAPTPGFAIYCPASFVVSGLPYSLEFDIDLTRTPEFRVVISGMRLSLAEADEITREGLGSIPVAYLLRAAMNAAAFTVLHYPLNYSGPVHAQDDDGTLVETPSTLVITDDEPFEWPSRHGGVMPADFAKAVSGLPELVGDQRLQQIAHTFRECAELGIAAGPRIAERFQVTERHARRLVQEARNAGYIDPLPTTDKRTRRSEA